MGKISLNKSVEATKLHERTEAPLVGPEVTIPFGALVEPAGASRDREKFRYLGELYSVGHDIFSQPHGRGSGPGSGARARHSGRRKRGRPPRQTPKPAS